MNVDNALRTSSYATDTHTYFAPTQDLKQWLLYGGQSSSLDTVGMHIQGATEINGSESACSSHRYLNLKRLASKLIDTSTSDC